MEASVPPSCSTILGRGEAVAHMWPVDLVRCVLNTFDGKETLQGEKARHFLNPIINKGSEVEERPLRMSGVAQYAWSNQLLIHYLVNVAGRLVYGIWRAELDT